MTLTNNSGLEVFGDGRGGAIFMSTANGSSIKRVMTLERAFSADQKVELEALKAWGLARHTRILQSFAGGIVDFPTVGTSDPYLVGNFITPFNFDLGNCMHIVTLRFHPPD